MHVVVICFRQYKFNLVKLDLILFMNIKNANKIYNKNNKELVKLVPYHYPKQ